MPDLRNIFPIGGLILFWPRDLTIFQRKIRKQLLSNSKAVNICENKKRRQNAIFEVLL